MKYNNKTKRMIKHAGQLGLTVGEFGRLMRGKK